MAASAGNHAQGVALASSVCGLRSTVFMPSGTSLPKIEATRSYGAEVRFEAGNVDDAIAAARCYADERGAYYVPPFDDPLVIAGQGTVGLEVANEVPDAEVVLVPLGGGGLVSGVAAALKGSGCHARVIGVEAAGAAAMLAALDAGGPVELASLATMADGIAVRCVSQLTFEHVRALVDEVIAVDEEQISRAVLLFLERCKWVVEPAGAVPLAALLAGGCPRRRPGRPGCLGGQCRPAVAHPPGRTRPDRGRPLLHGARGPAGQARSARFAHSRPRPTRAQPLDGRAPAIRRSGRSERSRGHPHSRDAGPGGQGHDHPLPSGTRLPSRSL